MYVCTFTTATVPSSISLVRSVAGTSFLISLLSRTATLTAQKHVGCSERLDAHPFGSFGAAPRTPFASRPTLARRQQKGFGSPQADPLPLTRFRAVSRTGATR